jgi:hypothetical protein
LRARVLVLGRDEEVVSVGAGQIHLAPSAGKSFPIEVGG